MSDRNETPAFAVGGPADYRLPDGREFRIGADGRAVAGPDVKPDRVIGLGERLEQDSRFRDFAREQTGRLAAEHPDEVAAAVDNLAARIEKDLVEKMSSGKFPPATSFDAAVETARREGRLVFVAFDREGRPLPLGTVVDRQGLISLPSGDIYERDIDAERTRHRSACEEKRRKAWWVGFWSGLGVATALGSVAVLLGLYCL